MPKKQNIVIIGTGGQAKVAADIARRISRIKLLGFVDQKEPKENLGKAFLGSYEDFLRKKSKGTLKVFVAIGDNFTREKVVLELEEVGYDFASLIHPEATVAKDVEIGEGTLVAAGAVINPGSRIGRHCVINTSSALDHDNRLGDYVTLSPGACTGGHVIIESRAFIGMGASIIHQVRLGEGAVLGAGSVLFEDLPRKSVAWGCPAKKRRTREFSEKIL